MIIVKFDNYIIPSHHILELPEIVDSLGFENQFYLETIQIQLLDSHGFYSDNLGNIYGSNPYRFIVTLYEDDKLIYKGKITNIKKSSYRQITVECQSSLDLDVNITFGDSGTFETLISSLIDNSLIDKNSLIYTSGYLTPGVFSYDSSSETTIRTFLTDVVTKAGIYIYIRNSKIVFSPMYSPFWYPPTIYRLENKNVFSRTNENSYSDLANQYSVLYIGNTTDPVSDSLIYEKSRLLYGIKDKELIDGSQGFQFGNRDTAIICMNNILDRFSNIFDKLTLEIPVSIAKYLNVGSIITYETKDYIVFSKQRAFNDLTAKIIIYSLGVNNYG